ncbi:MAG: FecR family protein [Chitinophagaceae bacterium]|nr:FecR family protein [Chitinophagaceae bacterium]
MKITHTLIQKFFDNRCTPAEAEAVARRLKQHPELMSVYLKASWEAVENENNIPAGYKEEMREEIEAHIKRHSRVIRFRWMAAAASVLIAALALWLFIPAAKTTTGNTLAKIEKQPDTTANWKQHANTTGKAFHLKLQDGSLVKLAPKAIIKYLEPFGLQGQRNIYMQGEAEFDVATHKTKPFTVHTKLFSTTALGTSFRVSETPLSCNVKLFQGKVLIRSQVEKLKGWKQDIMLLPGNEMRYSLEQGVSVNQFNPVQKQNPIMPENGNSIKEEQPIVFDNTPLLEVMKKLHAKYHSSIFYDEDELKGKFFSGEVLKSDSLSVLLKVISNMNGLQVTQKDNGYIITASK